ncbi:MAG: 30S ribosomal protein S4 [Planctomycetes bacterium]|nr:30S ribosomal protein S4 [Planctomycetota bacterium]
MARYTGPMAKVCRRLGLLTSRSSGVAKAVARREFPPSTGRRRKPSEYGLRLIEKQKLRYYYGCSEKQLRRIFKEANRMGGNAGHNLLCLLERRFDNVVCNLRFGRTVADARQLIAHGHVTINGKKMDIPSFFVNEGDVIAMRDRKSSKARAENTIATVGDYSIPDWISVDDKELTGKVLRLPTREDVRCVVDEQKVVEFYSR